MQVKNESNVGPRRGMKVLTRVGVKIDINAPLE